MPEMPLSILGRFFSNPGGERGFTLPVIQLLRHSFIHLFTHSFSHSFINSFVVFLMLLLSKWPVYYCDAISAGLWEDGSDGTISHRE